MRFLVFEHAPGEDGGRFARAWRRDGIAVDRIRWWAGERAPRSFTQDALLILSGPQNIWECDRHPWLAEEEGEIRRWLGTGRPALGICLGHQLLASALGGAVTILDPPEVGVLPLALAPRSDPLLDGICDLQCLLCHEAEVSRLPSNATSLGRTDRSANQLVRHRDGVYGVQFHVEADAAAVGRWTGDPQHRAKVEAVLGRGGATLLVARVASAEAALEEAAARLHRNFVQLVRGPMGSPGFV